MDASPATGSTRAVTIPAEGVDLAGDLTVPDAALGVVAFAHGSGSGRHSPRNREVAVGLAEARLATLLMDLLTEDEEATDLRTRELRFDIPLLAGRMVAAIDWLEDESSTNQISVGCFGASTGAAAALIAAARRPDRLRAVVSRGGRPDLARGELASVRAPTLLIVGGADPVVIDLNQQAQEQLHCQTRLEIVEGASHLFQEPGTLERVTELARDWFLSHLPGEQDAAEPMREPFADRRVAGRELAQRLSDYAGRDDVVVLGLPRGGVPVAYEVARALSAPLDVFVVRKLGVPGHEELAMGAIASGGVRVLNDEVVAATGIEQSEIEAVAERERSELKRRERAYRGDRAPLDVEDRTAVVVDDGLATGATMRAAVKALRERHAATIVAAVPTASPETCADVGEIVDEIVCAHTPERFMAVGRWYRDFTATSDDEVRTLLEDAVRTAPAPAGRRG